MAEALAKTGLEAAHYAALLPPLLLQAANIANTIEQGVHGRRRTGMGDSFWQFRPYHWGDDLRYIDWRQSAKSDRLFLRQTEWDAAQSAFLWCDMSPSMHYTSQKKWPEKLERALLLNLSLCHLLVRAGERVAYWDGAMRPISGKGAVERFMNQVSVNIRSATQKTLPPPAILSAHAQVILVSDFFLPLEDIAFFIHHLTEADIHGHLIQVTDPAEETMPFQGRIRFQGLEEEGNILFSRTENIRNAYLDKLNNHREGLRAITHNAGWTLSHHRTDQPITATLLHAHRALSVTLDNHPARRFT